VAVLALMPGAASAATCADYDNQAQAQRAADTRDANANGVYCESLPCPCLGRAKHPPGRRTQWSRARVLASVEQWAREVGKPPRSWEWAPSTARAMGRHDSVGVQKWLHEYPRWPGATAVYSYWGSWRLILNEAELSDVQALRLTLRERLSAYEQLRNFPDHVIADVLGVHELTVERYHRAGRCPSCSGLKITPDAEVCGLCAQRTKRAAPPRASIIAAIQAWEGETGTRPVAADWQLSAERWRAAYPRWPAAHQVQEEFGS
jgi:hypothetical protein